MTTRTRRPSAVAFGNGPSPYRRHGDLVVCLTCTAATRGRTTVTASDPVTHAEEMHPASAVTVRRQFAPVHVKINRAAR